MNFNYDIIRDILNFVKVISEEQPVIIQENSLPDRLKKYGYLELYQHAENLLNDHFIKGDIHPNGSMTLHSLSNNGEKLFESIQDERLWNKIKVRCTALDIASLPTFANLAMQMYAASL